MIEVVNNNTFRLVSRGHEMILRKSTLGWEMQVENSSTRAYRTLGIKYFDTLHDVEKHYKSWRGIAALVNLK